MDKTRESDSFDEIVRKVAHVSVPRLTARLAGQLSAGSSLAGGRLRVLRRIGHGGMGVVYEAFDEERRSSVALKTLTKLDAAGIYRLKNEFRALADVPHQNLVQLHELFADDGLWFFTMDLIDGVAFDRWVRPQGRMDEPRLRSSLRQLASAVSAIHETGKLHRDLKPSNALVRADGSVVVLDFGLAMDPAAGSVGQTIRELGISGTPGYMAPEQADVSELSSACDWYALGVMMFEALTGRLPFEGRAIELLHAKQTRPAPVPSDLVAALPADLDRLCGELLARDPARRPCGELVRARLGLAADSCGSAPPVRLALVGREQELEVLRRAFEASCQADKPVVVLLSGESGIGKSALVGEFLAQLRAQNQAVVLAGRCYERESLPYKACDALMDELSRYLRRMPTELAAALMPREVWALRRLFPVLGRVAAVADAPERGAQDAQELRRRGFLALGELLGRVRDRQPLVVSIDDLQWADDDSIALLLHLLRQADAPRLLLIVSHRSAGLAEQPILKPLYDALLADVRLDVRRLPLGPLSDEASSELVRAQLRGAGSERAEALAREAAGNPFLLGELLRSAGRAQAGSLAELLQQRIAELPELERGMLEVLAVAARPVALDLVASAVGALAARPAYETLRSAQLACSAGPPGSVECYHDKIREVLVSQLSAARSRELHQSLALALARRSDADPEQLCAHCEAAGEHERAAQYARRAAQRAADALAFERAASFYDKALALSSWDARERQRLRVARAEMLAHGGRGVLAGAAYLDALAGAGDSEAMELKRKAAEQYVYSGHLARGHALLEEALQPLGIRLPRSTRGAIASLLFQRARLRLRGHHFREHSQVDPHVAQKLAALHGAGTALIRTDALRGTDLLLRHLLLALDSGDAAEVCRALSWEVTCAAFLGERTERVAKLVSQAEVLCERTHDVESRAMLHFGRGLSHFYAPDALAEFQRCVALLREHALPTGYYNRAQAEVMSANQRVFRGELVQVARELPALIDEAWSRGDLCIVPMWCGLSSLLARMVVHDLSGGIRDLTRARAAWPEDSFTFQDFSLFQGELILARMARDGRAAWHAVQRYWPRFSASPLARVEFIAGRMRQVRAETAAVLAGQTRVASERAELLDLAARMAKTVAKGDWMSLPLRAGLAYQRGEFELAVAALREGVRRTPPLYAHAARRRLAAMLGGDEGAALQREADEFFSTCSISHAEQLTDGLLPACAQR
ncbi:MAG TPA: AAA family ATPase [Polyangiales bacterium]|nr:AAA family ATPase [Polyangiales bacterium]